MKCCQRHHMVFNPHTRKWILVPDDCFTELSHADLPVALVERHCPRCYEETSPRLKTR